MTEAASGDELRPVLAQDAQPIWARLPDETPPAWEGFVLYRDLGGDRSLAKVAQQLGKSLTLITRWSAEHDWVARAAAWDAHVDAYKLEAHLSAAEAMGQRHAARASELTEALLRPAQELERRLQLNPHILQDVPNDRLLWLLSQCARAMPGVLAAERLARGLPSTVAQANISKGSPRHDPVADIVQSDPAAALLHLGDRPADQPNGAHQRQIEGVLPGGVVEAVERSGRRTACVRHQHVYAAEMLRCRRDQSLDVLRPRHVDLQRQHLGSGIAYVGRGGLDAFLAAAAHHHVRAFAAECGRDPLAEPGARCGNDTRVELIDSGYPDTPEGRHALMDCACGWGEALTLVKFFVEHGVTY